MVLPDFNVYINAGPGLYLDPPYLLICFLNYWLISYSIWVLAITSGFMVLPDFNVYINAGPWISSRSSTLTYLLIESLTHIVFYLGSDYYQFFYGTDFNVYIKAGPWIISRSSTLTYLLLDLLAHIVFYLGIGQ